MSVKCIVNEVCIVRMEEVTFSVVVITGSGSLTPLTPISMQEVKQQLVVNPGNVLENPYVTGTGFTIMDIYDVIKAK